MAYWLVKSEPSVYNFQQLVKDKQTTWDGIRSYAARLHLNSMKKGEEILFYHSNEGTEIVGIAKVSKEAFPDTTGEAGKWVAIEIKPIRAIKKPVTLSQMKTDKRLANMALIRIGRLSVSPVTDAEWKVIMELAGEK